MLRILPDIRPGRASVQNITLRGFTGGLNTLDSDIGIDAKYAVILNNFTRTPNGTHKLRYGNQWFADIADLVLSPSNIVDMEYFVDEGLAVTDRGEIVGVDRDGIKTVRWNEAIANALPGNPLGWGHVIGSTTTVDFVPFKGRLLIHNGRDRPLRVYPNLNVEYLGDLGADNANTFVPIGRFGCTVGDYHVVAGVSETPTTIYVSAKGTDGTFEGAPNSDATSIDVGAYAPEGAPEIVGIAGFRAYLIVFFASQSLVIKLGVYETVDGVPMHKPQFPDTLPQFGLISHRCIMQVENDLIFAGHDGISSVRRNLQSAEVDSAFVSNRIEPTYRRDIGMRETEDLKVHAFMIKDKLEHNTVTYLPGGKAYTYTSDEQPKYQSWSTWTSPDWTCACTTFRGRVFYAQGTRLYQGGNSVFDGEKFSADKLHDRDALWTINTGFSAGDLVHNAASGKTYRCVYGHLSGATTIEDDIAASPYVQLWEEYLGIPISFELETPWMDGANPMLMKQTRFLSMNTKGTAPFTVKAYVDNLYKNFDGEVVYEPGITMDFVGNDAVGFGLESEPYGGGRRSHDPRLYKFPVRFKTLKLNISGSTVKPLEIGTVSILFSSGRYKR